MSRGVRLWDRFVADGVRDSAVLADGISTGLGDLMNDAPARDRLAGIAFRLATQALLLGAEDIGKLALACERALELIGEELMVADGLLVLASSSHTLAQAFDVLASPDASGARTEGVPLEAARFELETLFPVPGKGLSKAKEPDVPIVALRRAPSVVAQAEQPAATATDAGFVWQPSVDDDMIGLFFEEAEERIEELAVKLVDMEQSPNDQELLRDVFRDLHTVKGSSAMVALDPMNKLAHAAEDLVGQLREGDRRADSDVVDALLGALDGLRGILRQARDTRTISHDARPIIERLRDPRSRPATDEPSEDVAAAPAVSEDRRKAVHTARQTIRVDFDKLDRLLNLVGELVLGRDGLHAGIQSLQSVTNELASDRTLTRRIGNARRAIVAGASAVPVPGGRRDVRSALSELGEEIGRVERVLVDISQDLDYSTGRLDSVSGELRDQVMKLRMVPVGGVFRKHHRTVRDLANSLGKRARLELRGEDTELDKLLVEALDEPLMHLVRNAVDHGIELPEQRIEAGKSPEGRIELSAVHRGNQVVIQILDDGGGLDPAGLRKRAEERGVLTAEELEELDDKQVLHVIFQAGFSTAERVSEVSGRGVGMDVVRQTIVTRLKGVIDIESTQGAGSVFTLRLPLTLAIINVLLVRTAGEIFAVPLDTVTRSLTVHAKDINLIEDREFIHVRDSQVPLIRLTDVLELEVGSYGQDSFPVILTEYNGDTYAIACEHLVGKKEIVIKSLGDVLQQVPCAAGATLLGERCAIILDIPAIVRRTLGRRAGRISSTQLVPVELADGEQRKRVLLVEDSEIVRESLRRLLVNAGYDVTTASDGVEGLAVAERQHFDLVSTDVMMPRMDGYELTRALRATAAYKDAPIIMVTSKGERIDRVRGFDAGVDEYITKPHDRQLLLRVVRKLLGSATGGEQ